MKPLYIFDLDGTLADCTHRLPHITGEAKDWRAFFAACNDDTPIEAMIRTLLSLDNGGAEAWIWTGRSDEAKDATIEWLRRHGLWRRWRIRPPEALLMRKAGDHRPDHVLKYEWLANLEPPERNRLTAVFEDRSRVVQMWREAGVPCFQVAPGDF